MSKTTSRCTDFITRKCTETHIDWQIRLDMHGDVVRLRKVLKVQKGKKCTCTAGGFPKQFTLN